MMIDNEKSIKDKKLMQKMVFLRKSKGLTLRDIEAKAGIPRSNWQGYEAGTSKPDYTNLRKIVKFFKVSADWVLNLENGEDVNTDEQNTES